MRQAGACLVIRVRTMARITTRANPFLHFLLTPLSARFGSTPFFGVKYSMIPVSGRPPRDSGPGCD